MCNGLSLSHRISYIRVSLLQLCFMLGAQQSGCLLERGAQVLAMLFCNFPLQGSLHIRVRSGHATLPPRDKKLKQTGLRVKEKASITKHGFI